MAPRLAALVFGVIIGVTTAQCSESARDPTHAGTNGDAGFDGGDDAGTTTDAGATDGGTTDAGPRDAGTTDAGTTDAGLPDCTPLSGQITQLAKGVYCVTGDVIIPAGTNLNIPAGTELVFTGRYHFGLDPALPDTGASGGLTAIGTAAEPIVFRGATPDTAWLGIVIAHSGFLVQLEYVTIRDTYKDDRNPSSRIWKRGGALGSYVNLPGIVLRHVQFVHNRAWQVAGALDVNSINPWPDYGTVEITDSLFEDNSCECGTYSGSADDKCGGGAIRFSHIGGTKITLARNTFRNNRALSTAGIDAYGGGIGAFDCGLPLGPGNLFENNSAQKADGAISCAGHPSLGVNFKSVDPSNVFTGSSPDVGCGL